MLLKFTVKENDDFCLFIQVANDIKTEKLKMGYKFHQFFTIFVGIEIDFARDYVLSYAELAQTKPQVLSQILKI